MKKRKPESRIYTIKVYCAKCKTLLYRYQKEGPGLLVKCYKDRIIEDYTNRDFLV